MRHPVLSLGPLAVVSVVAIVVATLSTRAPSARAGGGTWQVRDVEYSHGDVKLKGHMARPVTVPAAGAPAVLVIHDWLGCGDFAKRRADSLAEAGIIALALDMYGGGKVASGPEEAGKLAGAFYKDPALMVARVKAGLDVLRAEPGVLKARIAVIGFCFGGSCALQLARSGEDVAGVVSFHGTLKTSAPAAEGAIKAKVLVLHGGADPYAPSTQVAEFMDEMNKAKATWRMEVYGGAVHAFTDPAKGTDASKGAAYNEDAEKRSKAAQDQFFAEILR